MFSSVCYKYLLDVYEGDQVTMTILNSDFIFCTTICQFFFNSNEL